VRIIIWHGYLLGGTGSNVYTRALARSWSNAGHDVVVLCQEPEPGAFDLGGARVARPPLDGPLPVFVLDHYGHANPRLLGDLTPAERQHFVDVNAAAILAEGTADVLLVNHVLLGAPIGASVRAASGAPFVVKAHGSELEYAMRGNAELCAWASASLDTAGAVLAGSEHIVGVLQELVDIDSAKVHVVPPGVDVDALAPQERGAALAALVDECAADPANAPRGAPGHDERLPDPGNAERLGSFLDGDRPTVVYVGKLSEEKGVGLLVDAMRGRDATCVIVGFGPARGELEERAGDNVVFAGPLEHRHLAHLWPLADVSVTPSIFPEAFGMVAAEAASSGSPPLVARHSGLAEIAAALEAEYPSDLAHLASFSRGDGEQLRSRLDELLALPSDRWRELSQASRRAATSRWSWAKISDRILEVASLS